MDITTPITVLDAEYVSGNLTEDEYPEWASGQMYTRGQYRRVLSTHSIYQCLRDHTSSGTNSPTAEAAAFADPLVADPDPAHWVYISQTNKWRLFDGRPSQRAARANMLTAGVRFSGATRTTSAGLQSRTTSGLVSQSVLLTTAGAGMWTVPAGVTSIIVELVGGGGAGGRGSASGAGGGRTTWDAGDDQRRAEGGRGGNGGNGGLGGFGGRGDTTNGSRGSAASLGGGGGDSGAADVAGLSTYGMGSDGITVGTSVVTRAAGGGGGGYTRFAQTVTPGASISYSVGAAGSGAATSGAIRITYGGSGTRTTMYPVTRSTSITPKNVESIGLVNLEDCAVVCVNMRVGGPSGFVVYTNEYEIGPDLDGLIIDDISASLGADYVGIEMAGGSDLACGQIILGAKTSIGETQVGESGLEGLDFSHIETNIYGDLTTVERAATTIGRFDVRIPVAKVNEFANIMNQFRGGKAALWVGDTDQGARAWTYGFARDWNLYFSDGVFARVRLVVQGIV